MIKFPFTVEDIPYTNKAEYKEIIEEYNKSPISSLFPIIDNKIFHRRSLKDTIKIFQDGCIYSNTNNYYEKTDGSENCFAYKNNYISLFDFHQLPFNILLSHDKWYTFFYDKIPITILMQFERDGLCDHIISNSVRRSCKENTGNYFPYVEIWYPEPLSVEFIEKIFITFCKKGKIIIEDITHHSRIENSGILPELSDLLQRQDEYIHTFCQRLLQISQLHELNLEDPLINILTSLQ